jgi:ribosome biogenesis GTPase A
MWPKIELSEDGELLAINYAIGKNAYFEEEIAQKLAFILIEKYPELIRARYKIAENLDSPVSFLELIAKKRGTPPTKYGFDLKKASEILLNDYRSGAIGRISLESPASRLEMLERHQTLKNLVFKA